MLKKAIDETKDQSYVLYSMTQHQLEHTKFPLGNLKKTQVREIAENHGFINAKKLAQLGFKVLIPGGEVKSTTEAIVGMECVVSLQQYNFSKCFMGANGVSLTGGLSTPDKNEALIKSTVIQNSRQVYILADHSKFDRIASAKFANISCGEIITDKLTDKKFFHEASIKEVL